MNSPVTGAAVGPVVAASAYAAWAPLASEDASALETGSPSLQVKEPLKPVQMSVSAAEALSGLPASSSLEAGSQAESVARPWEEQHGPFWPGQIPWFTEKQLRALRTDPLKAAGAETAAPSANGGGNGPGSAGLTAAIASAQSRALASHASEPQPAAAPVNSPGSSVPPSSNCPTCSEPAQRGSGAGRRRAVRRRRNKNIKSIRLNYPAANTANTCWMRGFHKSARIANVEVLIFRELRKLRNKPSAHPLSV